METASPIQALQSTLAVTSIEDQADFKTTREFLSKFTDLEVLRHWANHPLPNAPKLLEEAVGVAPDLEWLTQDPKNKIIDQIEGKITQIGWTVFSMSILKECHTPAEFPALIKKAAIYYVRVIENCHLRAKEHFLKDTEINPLYCPTRFVSEAEAKTILSEVLDNQVTADGRKRPVVLIGHGWNFDEQKLNQQWGFKFKNLDSILFKVRSLGRVAAMAGVIPWPNRDLGEGLLKLDEMLRGFQIDLTNMWRHDGANDALYQMTLAFLIVLFPILYPGTTAGFPTDASIAGLSINDIWTDVASNKDNAAPVDKGFARFCFYCDATDDHDGTDESPCPSKESDTILCKLCANAIGKKNKRYRDRAHGHQTHRCTLQWSHQCRKFPEVIKPADWSLDDKRALTRGMALADDAMIGAVFRKNIIGEGPIDWTVVADEEKRLEFEATQYSSGEEKELDEDEE